MKLRGEYFKANFYFSVIILAIEYVLQRMNESRYLSLKVVTFLPKQTFLNFLKD